MQFLLKSIIKGTGFPPNYVDSYSEVDFARTVVMQNALLVRTVISDQNQFKEILTDIVRKLYRNEFGNIYEDKNELEETISKIRVEFSIPVSLNITNINEQINNASQSVDFIVNAYFSDETSGGMGEDPSEVDLTPLIKTEFKKNVIRDLLPALNWGKYDKMYSEAKLKVTEDTLKQNSFKTTEDIQKDSMGGGMDDMSGMDSGMEGGEDMPGMDEEF